MNLDLYQVDAFAERVFSGNPAAVCPLDAWLADEVLQQIAMENNLSETAFFVKSASDYTIRWFTPTREVELCGHATLASAYVLFHILGFAENEIRFESKSGLLRVTRNQDWLEMDFPSQAPVPCETPRPLLEAFEQAPIACLAHQDYIVVFAHEREVIEARPNLSKLSELDRRGVAITARSTACDFVLRFFAPKYGIDEDPVTGSAFTQLLPYWSTVLGKTEFHARQVSTRGGEVKAVLNGDRVRICGKAVCYLRGVISI